MGKSYGKSISGRKKEVRSEREEKSVKRTPGLGASAGDTHSYASRRGGKGNRGGDSNCARIIESNASDHLRKEAARRGKEVEKK